MLATSMANLACARDLQPASEPTVEKPDRPDTGLATDPTGGMTPAQREEWHRRYQEQQERQGTNATDGKPPETPSPNEPDQ
jgi:hypothetical protein